MNQNAREALSALMDNEGDELELRRVLKVSDGAAADADAWRRYHLVRSLMQRDRDIDVSTDLSAGIMARIADEPLPEREVTPAKRTASFSFGGGAAIAAAVSLMVITGVQVYNSGGIDGTVDAPTVASETPPAAGSAQPVVASAGASAAGAASAPSRPSLVDLPMFQSQPQGNQGVMTVGASADMPMFMAPNTRQSQRGDQEQAQILQSYLDRHAEGSAYRSGDAWMPLLRASGLETLGQR